MSNKSADLKNKEQERAELHRTIWQIANDVRGSIAACIHVFSDRRKNKKA